MGWEEGSWDARLPSRLGVGPRRHTPSSLLLAGMLVWLSSYLFVFGSAMLCCAAALPDRIRLIYEQLLFGVVPVGLAVCVFKIASRKLAGEFSREKRRLILWVLVSCTGLLNLFVLLKLSPDDDELKIDWNAESRVFDWGPGQVEIPKGFGHQKLSGIDTMMGQFTSDDGKVTIQYDIGAFAGEHGGARGSETLRQGLRVRTLIREGVDENGAKIWLVKASFPDCGCASFAVTPVELKDGAVLDAIVKSFRPKRGVFSWFVPLLPEILRSDCRYRFRAPV